MSDGRITIAVVANDSDIDKLVGKLKGVEAPAQQSSNSIAKMAVSLGLVKVASAAFDVLKNSMGAAISRFDTFNTFPKVMKALGFSTEESSDAINKLGDGIDGLPTKLDDVVNTAKRMTSVTGNLDESTDATIALNNAMLASGASTSDASRGMDQYIQMLSTGQVDLQSWKTLQETMPIGLQKTAEAMGFVGQTAQRDLYGALKSGEVTFKEFQTQLIELGTGTGELAELAKANSEGIATSFSNLANTASKGLANLLTALDKAVKEATGKNIAKQVDSLKVIINKAFEAIAKSIELTVPVIKLFVGALKLTFNVAKALSPILAGLAASFVVLKVVGTVNDFLTKHKTLLALAGGSSKALTLATKEQIAAIVAKGVVDKADIANELTKNGAVKLSTLLIGVLTNTTKASTAAQVIGAVVAKAFGSAITFMLGPIGLAIIAITAVVAAVVGVVKWFKKASDETENLRDKQSELVSETEAMSSSTKDAIKSRESSIKSIESNGQAYHQLADDIISLSEQETKSAADKKLLQESISQLNGSVTDLGLAYDEETDKLSLSAELMKARIDAQKEQETANVAQQNLVEILKEQNLAEMELEHINKLREEWNAKVEEGTGNIFENSKIKRDAKVAGEELDEQEKMLTETISKLGTQEQLTRDIIQESSAAAAQAVEDGVNRQVISYEGMSESQKEAVDAMTAKWHEYQEAATDMFNTLSDEQTISVQEMTDNMAENQRVIGEWADNIALLAERGIDEGLLNTLREAGPSSAGHVSAIVNSSDEELSRMNEVFQNGAKTATDGLSTGFDVGKTDVEKSVMGLMDTAKTSLASQIKAADFNSLGKQIPAGAAAGVKAGSKEAEGATKDMGSKMSKGFATEMGIHSPSRVFKQFGSFITQGLAQGVKQGVPLVTSAMNAIRLQLVNGMTRSLITVKQLSSRIPRQFDGLSGQMSGIGRNIMYGLSAGIWAGSGSAISAAQSVANRIKSTIKSAMDIHSPSRWMREFIGKNMMEGWGIGLEKYADLPDNAVQDVIGRVKRTITTADVAVANTGGVGGLAAINNVYNNQTNNTGSGGHFTVEVPVILDGREVARSITPVLTKEQDRIRARERRLEGRTT